MGKKYAGPKTTHQAIADHWFLFEKVDDCGLGSDYEHATTRCWRCAEERDLERCHITPASQGGSDEPSNLVLLCGQGTPGAQVPAPGRGGEGRMTHPTTDYTELMGEPDEVGVWFWLTGNGREGGEVVLIHQDPEPSQAFVH